MPQLPTPKPAQYSESSTGIRKETWLLWGALLFALALACFVERDIFFNPYAINDDVRNQIYWMAQLMNPQYFPHDYIASYFTQPVLVSPVLEMIYSAFTPWVSPLRLSQWMPFPLVLLATFFLFKFCRTYCNTSYAFWTCFAFNCSIWIFKNMAGGLSRAFIYPLLFLSLWLMSRNYWVGVTISLLLAALIYPPAFLLVAVLILVELLRFYRKDAFFKHRLISLLTGIGGSLALLQWRSSQGLPSAFFGQLSGNRTTEGLRDFFIGGRIVLFPWGNLSTHWPKPIQFIGEILERFPRLDILIPTGIFLLFLYFYQSVLKQRLGSLIIPGKIWRLLLSSVILYITAWACLFQLYVPERYLQYTLPLIPTFIFGTLFYRLQEMGRTKILIGFLSLTLAITGLFWRDDLMNPKSQERALFHYLSALPTQAMIAAPPGLASNIPLYSFRSVYISNEAYIPFHQRYFHTVKNRFQQCISAYYTDDPKMLAEFIRRNHVDYLVVQLDDFSASHLGNLSEKYYHAFEPAFFDSIKAKANHSVLRYRVPQNLVDFKTANLRVIKTQTLLRYLESEKQDE